MKIQNLTRGVGSYKDVMVLNPIKLDVFHCVPLILHNMLSNVKRQWIAFLFNWNIRYIRSYKNVITECLL